MRPLATLLAVMALTAQLGSFAHLSAVQHVTCAEHGELIEVRGEHPLLTRDERVVTAAGEAHGHDHCLLAPLRRDRAALDTPIIAAGAHPGAFDTLGRDGDATPARPIALLFVAPKNSPPRA
jgi:hypothetical protein